MSGNYISIGYLGGQSGGGPPTFGESSLGANDVASRASAYLVNDFASAGQGVDISSFVSGSGNYAGAGSGAVALNPGEAATHPGLWCVQTNAVGYGVVTSYNNGIIGTAASPATYTWNINFRTPNVASNSTDTYKFYAGCSAGIAATYPGTGAGIAYTSAANGGNWMIYTNYPANELEADTNTNVPFVPATWMNVQVVLSAGKFTISLNGTVLGTLTDGSLVGTTQWVMSAGGISMQRTAVAASSPPNISAVLDRAALYITGLAR